jgi:hypothetical protein
MTEHSRTKWTSITSSSCNKKFNSKLNVTILHPIMVIRYVIHILVSERKNSDLLMAHLFWAPSIKFKRHFNLCQIQQLMWSESTMKRSPKTPNGLRFSEQIRKFHEWQFTRQGDFKTQSISFIEFQEQEILSFSRCCSVLPMSSEETSKFDPTTFFDFILYHVNKMSFYLLSN